MKIRYSVEFNNCVQSRYALILAARAFLFSLLLCLGSVHGWAQQNNQQEMRGLDGLTARPGVDRVRG